MYNMSLENILKNQISIEDYFGIVDQLTDSLEKMQREDMQIVLDISRMSIKDGKLQFSIEMDDAIYELTRIKEFIKSMTFQCVFGTDEQCAAVTKFLKLIDTVSEVNFYRVVRQFCAEQLNLQTIEHAKPIQHQQANYNKQIHYMQNSADGETGVLSNSFWENLENQYNSQSVNDGRMGNASGFQNVRPSENLSDNEANGETGVLDPSFWQQISQGGSGRIHNNSGRLVHAKTGKVVVINKQNFWIGKGEVDLKIDKETVSRKHAQIIVKQNHYFISDNDSTNKTFVEGKEIPPKASIELFDGMHIKFANEEYVFQM